MTQETLPAPSEPLERRILNSVGAALGVVVWWVVLAQYLDVPGPQDLFERARDRLHEQRRWRRAMEETLLDIEELPEVELEPIGKVELELDDELGNEEPHG